MKITRRQFCHAAAALGVVAALGTTTLLSGCGSQKAERAVNAFSVPYVFDNQEHYYNVMDSDLMEEIYKSTENGGFRGLFWLDSGARSFYTADTPIRVPSDLKGLKIRTMDSQMAIKMMKCLGGSATIATSTPECSRVSLTEQKTTLLPGVTTAMWRSITASMNTPASRIW